MFNTNNNNNSNSNSNNNNNNNNIIIIIIMIDYNKLQYNNHRNHVHHMLSCYFFGSWCDRMSLSEQ